MLIDHLRKRHSIRKYTHDPVDTSKLDTLKEAALSAPSSHNRKPWHFIFIQDKERLEDLSQCKKQGASFLKHAALAVVVCADSQLSDVWVEDCAIAATYIQLTAHDLGLGCCWIQIRNRLYAPGISAEQYIRDLLNLPSSLRVDCIQSIGVSAVSPEPDEHEPLPFEKIHMERYSP
jgi:nitroreductase